MNPFNAIAQQQRKQILGIFGPPKRKPVVPPIATVLSRANIRVLRLRYRNDLTFREIALATESTEDAVLKMHGRVLDRIRMELAARKILTIDHI